LFFIIEPIIKAQNPQRNLKPSKKFEKKICIKWEIEKPSNTLFFLHGQHQDVPGHLQTCLGEAIGQSGKKMLLYCLQ
jgi:hypothetical protein